MRRTEKAVTGFVATTSSISDETRELVAHQTSENTAMSTRTNDWAAATTRSLEEGQRNNNAAHLTTSGLVKKSVASSQAAEAELGTGAQSLNAIAVQQRDAALQACKDSEAASTTATATLERLALKATADTQTESEKIKETVHVNGEKFEKASLAHNEHLSSVHEHVRAHVEAETDDLFDTEADAVHYVMQEIKRDPKDPARRKEYVYPKEYKATADYAVVLKDTPADWTREVEVRDGKTAAGQGPDYPGERGPADTSGLLTTTKAKPLQQPDQEALDAAARESDTGEYSAGEEDEQQEEVNL